MSKSSNVWIIVLYSFQESSRDSTAVSRPRGNLQEESFVTSPLPAVPGVTASQRETGIHLFFYLFPEFLSLAPLQLLPELLNSFSFFSNSSGFSGHPSTVCCLLNPEIVRDNKL
jgi:hypothetical protein